RYSTIQPLHSFPTRRSSDLPRGLFEKRRTRYKNGTPLLNKASDYDKLGRKATKGKSRQRHLPDWEGAPVCTPPEAGCPSRPHPSGTTMTSRHPTLGGPTHRATLE